jgi:glycosyltransferase involved in cell wall biosynthesis
MQLKQSIRTVKALARVKVVAPSHWLAGLAEKSSVLCGESIAVITNPVPNLFQPTADQGSGNVETLKIGFVSENLDNPYKGLHVLLEALEKLPTNLQAEVRLMGKGLTPELKRNVTISSKHISSPVDMAHAIQSCDVIVVPSLQDNSPSVISESLMCGVPVIGSKVGGITELMEEFELPSFEKGNSQQLSQMLENFDIAQAKRLDHKKIQEKFAPQTSAQKHLEIYSEILA